MSFSDFGLDPRCLKILKDQGIETPMPVQAQAMPVVLGGHDLVATAQTGTGKTLGFALPCLTQLSKGKLEKNMMLVMVPTRELAVQVHSVISQYGQPLNLRSTTIYGGVGMGPQFQALRRGVHVIVATPGRLLDHLEQGSLNFKKLKMLVLDEADRMLDMGFLPDIKRIISQLPSKRQTLMFSATFADDIAALAKEMLNDPERISIGVTTKPVDTVKQSVYPVKTEDKSELLLRILDEEKPESALVFMRTRFRTDRIGKMLKQAKYSVAVIHGNRTQAQRQQGLDGFKRGKYQILVATDVAARGLDVDGISHVFNFDIPDTPDAYIHRIGRTGRAQATGDAITFVAPEDRQILFEIEKTIGKPLPKEMWEKAPDISFKPRSKNRGGSSKGASKDGRSGGRSGGSSGSRGRFGRTDKKKSSRHPNPHRFAGRGERSESKGGDRSDENSRSRFNDGTRSSEGSRSRFNDSPRSRSNEGSRSRFGDSPRSGEKSRSRFNDGSRSNEGSRSRSSEGSRSRFSDSPRSGESSSRSSRSRFAGGKPKSGGKNPWRGGKRKGRPAAAVKS